LKELLDSFLTHQCLQAFIRFFSTIFGQPGDEISMLLEQSDQLSLDSH
jgi:hypothetical protein